MYLAYFGLKQEPFSIAPDPRLLFMSERHREALAHLLYGVRGGGGFVLLTGEIGTGKTTVCRSFLEQVPENCNLAYIFNPKLTVLELLETVCHEFGIEVSRGGTVKDYLDPLNAFLLQAHAAGRNNVLVIDEAQNLSAEVLEQLRLLTNLETSERKLLQIILIGQPELREILARPELEQLAQRVIARYHLQALGEGEAAQYVRHRMDASGLDRPFPFDRRALQRIHRLTGGVPRRINLLCDRALLGAYAGGQATVTPRIVEQAAAEVFDPAPAQAATWRKPALAMGLGLALGAGLLAAATNAVREEPAAASAAPAPAAKADAKPAAAPEPPVSRQVALLDNEAAAWRELASSWKLSPGDGKPCEVLREEVQCANRKINLALIRQIDRPGVLTLDAGTSRPSYAILIGLGDKDAVLAAGGAEYQIPIAKLAERWQGEFGTMWRRAEVSKPADLRAFQVAQGLPADGVPGPFTSMQLNRAAGVDEPRLRKVP
ncbi:MAG: AAA family ATPase [Burkholderiales bacterium]|nr:AAA family ATPase [Burkholderiales bacterium]